MYRDSIARIRGCRFSLQWRLWGRHGVDTADQWLVAAAESDRQSLSRQTAWNRLEYFCLAIVHSYFREKSYWR